MWTAHAGTQLNPSVAIYRDRWIVGAMLAALILRLTNLDAAALWLDETITVTWIRLPWPEMLRSVMGDNHLPLYPALIKAWATIAGTAPWALRLPSVICSWATVPLIAAAAYVLLGPMQARWAAWLSALSPYLLQHAQEGRMYALLGLLSATSLLQLAQFMQGRSQRLGLWFFTINLCLLLTHYYSV